MSATFKIENQVPRMRAQVGGGFVDVMEVTFTTRPSGIVGKVDIPTSAYTADEVGTKVGAMADLLEQVQGL